MGAGLTFSWIGAARYNQQVEIYPEFCGHVSSRVFDERREKDNVNFVRASLLVIPVLLALVMLVYIIMRSLIRAWIEHRVRMAILEKAEKHPELLSAFEERSAEAKEVSLQENPEAPKVDITLVGVSLTVIGIVFVVFNSALGKSQWGVGAYFGGVACVVIGFLLVTIGLLLRFLEQGPTSRRKP